MNMVTRTLAARWASLPKLQRQVARQADKWQCQAVPNMIGVHALVFSGGWTKEECSRAISGARAAGFDLIEIPLLDPDTVDSAMTKQELQFNEMRASTSLGLSDNADISSEDPAVVQAGVDLLMKCLQKTQELGAQYMCGVLTSAMKKYPVPCTPLARANVVTSIKLVAREAATRGVTLGLEVVNRYETNVFNTAAEAMALIAEIDEPNVMVHLDTYHMNIEEASMEAAVRTCGDRLGYVHIGEGHRGYLGTGSVDFKGLFRALVDTQYKGPITFESFSSAVVSKDLSNTLCIWRNLWTDGDDLAQHARLFIEAEIVAAQRIRKFHS